jgi:hypothetical protein
MQLRLVLGDEACKRNCCAKGKSMHQLPWLTSLATAVWFGFMAYRAGRNWALWVVGGALFALVTTTLVLGVAEAAFIPLSHDAMVRFQALTAFVAVLVVAVAGWLFTLDLQRWYSDRRKEQKEALPLSPPGKK